INVLSSAVHSFIIDASDSDDEWAKITKRKYYFIRRNSVSFNEHEQDYSR
ncbi:hypothetical protein INT48_005642, partial [Thamnidium elegans]